VTPRFVPAAVLAALTATGAAAQQPRRAEATRTEAVRDSTPRIAGDEREVPGVVVTAMTPRSFRVVTVALPPELSGVARIDYEIVPTGAVSLLGARTGTLAGGGAVVLTVGVPATASAGLTRAGFVRFAAGASGVRAPIDVEITRIARIVVTPTQPMRGAHPGDRIQVSFAILNAGNTLDTLDLDVSAPESWNAQIAGGSRVVVQRGETVERSVTASIPPSADLGDGAVTLTARSRSGERAVASSIVEVSDPGHGTRRPGPVVTVGAASALSAGLPTRAVESVAIDGPVTDAVTVSGRFSTPVPDDLVGGRALATVGYNAQANFFSLAAPTWGATVGTTGLSLDDLAGQNVFGRGASLRVGPTDERVQLLAAAPLAGQEAFDTPTLFAATTQKQFGVGTVTAFFAHLHDSTYLVRSVDALGLSLETQPWTNAYASGSVAGRSYLDGSGIGAEADFHGPLAGGDLSLHLTHAPGGTSAFAPARDAMSFGADRAFGRLRTSFGAWSTRDDDLARNAIGSSGWSISPTYPLFPTFSLGVDVLRSALTSRDSAGGFGSTQTDFGVRAQLLRGGFDVEAETRLSAVSQNVADSSVSVDDEGSRRLIDRVRIDRAGARGTFGVSASIETASFGATAMPPQSTLDAHVDRFQFWPRFPRWTVSASAQSLRVGEVTVLTSRAELDVDVRGSLRIALGAERGTARDALGVLHTVVTLKVERSSSVGAFDRRVVMGVVFEDRNGNGVRDAGEPGVPGIVVHRGTETAVTDRNGEYRLTSGSTARAEIDDRSLPRGWMTSPRLLDRSDLLELGVIPMAALDVRIDVAPLADGSTPAVRVGTATLTLRDSSGREWVARADASLHATFDAMPPGRYTLSTDLDGSSEPLTVDPVPDVVVGGSAGRQRVVVTVRTRPVRIFKTKQQVDKRDRGAS
jgi:NPCBM-associated, NEW3 domain of alpha-galactosidase